MEDLKRGLEELSEALPSYHTAHEYYRGDVRERFSSPIARRLMQTAAYRNRFNFAKRPVDAVADRLEIAGITTTDQGSDEIVQRVWEDNALDLEAPSIMRRACEYGDAYVIVWPAEGDDQALDSESSTPDGRTLVNVYYNSPLTTRIVYDAENPRIKSYAIKRWIETIDGKPRHRVDLFYPDRIEKYISREQSEGNRPKDYEQYVDAEGDEWPYENPFGEIPVFHFRTDRPYGKPLHEGFYGPQDAINKLIASHLDSVDYQGFPQRYALAAADANSADAANEDDFTDFETDQQSSPAPDQESQFVSDPGSLWFMRGVNQVGQFDVADPVVFTGPMVTYLKFGAELTNTPLHRVDPTGDHPSGESLRTAEAPFIKSVRYMQLSFGATWRELVTFALRLAGVDNVSVAIQWAPAQTMEDKDFWEVAEKKIAAGVPKRQVLMEAGYTDAQVTEWLDTTSNGQGN